MSLAAPPSPDDPRFAAIHTDRIEHDRDRALAELEALVVAQPTSVIAWSTLSQVHHRRLDFAASAAAATRALALEALRRDPEVLARAELQLEQRQIGRFRRLVT